MIEPIEISAVVPLYNEEEGFAELDARLTKALESVSPHYEIIYVNDASRDTTLQKIKDASAKNERIKYLSFSRNFGHQIALTAGLHHAKGNAVVIIDGDLQDPPELIPELYAKWKEGFKVVYAKRAAREGESFFKKFTARVFYRIVRKIATIDIPLDTGDFRLIDKKVVYYLNQMPESNKFIRGQISWIGFKQTFVEYDRDRRKFGTTNFTVRKMLSFAIDGITAFSNVPLKLATILGFLVSGFAFLVILYALFSAFVLNRVVPGWTSSIISSMFIGGIQLLTIGIIGEYISRITGDVRKRPLYILEESNTNTEEKE